MLITKAMKTRTILVALLLMVAGMQAAVAQGFRVYKTDGTFTQYSIRTDSIVFYDGIGEEVDFGPFSPVNQLICGVWYDKTDTLAFNEDGTTDFMEGDLAATASAYGPEQSLTLNHSWTAMLMWR